MLLLCLLKGMSSKYLGGDGAVEVGLGRGPAVLSPESTCSSCQIGRVVRLCYRAIPPATGPFSPQTWVGILIQITVVVDQVVEV